MREYIGTRRRCGAKRENKEGSEKIRKERCLSNEGELRRGAKAARGRGRGETTRGRGWFHIGRRGHVANSCLSRYKLERACGCLLREEGRAGGMDWVRSALGGDDQTVIFSVVFCVQ